LNGIFALPTAGTLELMEEGEGSAVETPPASTTAGAYRADIDGLRAVAVASVIAYHYFPISAHGGFIGVDIFFVISGFLITSILAKELGQKRVNFGDFYARRICRIFPALAVVLAFCLVVGAALLDPSEYRALGLHVAAGAGFFSNALLWSESGYFDEAAEYKPLLHLWSLAVEEQFYVIWPLALYICVRFGRSLWALALLFAGASFALNLYLSAADPVAGFYFVFSRIWELLIGGALALIAPTALATRPALANLAAMFGLALIVLSLHLIDAAQPFPGWRALGPTFGAALLIAAGPTALINQRILSLAAMVAIGRISYPLYLWHWPLLSFARTLEGGNVGPPVRWALIAVAIGLAQLTYIFVEKPIRFGAGRPWRTAAAAVAIASLGPVGALDFKAGGLLFPNAGFARVVNDGDVGYSDRRNYIFANSFPCHSALPTVSDTDQKNGFACRQSMQGVPPEIILIGDSHAAHFYIGLSKALNMRNVGYYSANGKLSFDDPSFNLAFAAVAAEPRIKTVILSWYWPLRIKAMPTGASVRTQMDRIVPFLRAAGKTVFILNDVPSFPFRPERCKYTGRLGLPNRCDEEESALERQLSVYVADLQAVIAANPGVRLIDTAHMLCNERICSMAQNGKLLYADENHLNINGSLLMGAKLVAATPDL